MDLPTRWWGEVLNVIKVYKGPWCGWLGGSGCVLGEFRRRKGDAGAVRGRGLDSPNFKDGQVE